MINIYAVLQMSIICTFVLWSFYNHYYMILSYNIIIYNHCNYSACLYISWIAWLSMMTMILPDDDHEIMWNHHLLVHSLRQPSDDTVKPRLHDTTVLNKQLFVQPVLKPGCTAGLTNTVWQPVVSCKRGLRVIFVLFAIWVKGIKGEVGIFSSYF